MPQGFETLVHDGVVLRVQDIVTRNYSMKIGAVATSVTVESGAAIGAGRLGGVGTVIDRRFVENMPLNGRSFQSLITLAPGVVLTPTTGQSQGQFQCERTTPQCHYFSVDGVSANFGSSSAAVLNNLNGSVPAFNASGGTNGLVSVDALQEFRIQTPAIRRNMDGCPGGRLRS